MRVEKKDLLLYLLGIIPSAVCLLFRQIKVVSIVSLVVFLVFMYLLYRKNVFFYVKYFSLVIGAFLAITGVAICEFSSIDLYEINSIAGYNGSLPTFVFFNIVFFLTLFMTDGNAKAKSSIEKWGLVAKNEKPYPLICHYISILSTVVLLLLFIRIIRTPAFLMGYDRFQFSQMVQNNSGIWKLVDNISYALILFPAFDLINKHRLTGTLGISFYILYNLWNGNKFGPFFTLVIIFLLVYYEKIVKLGKIRIHRFIVKGTLIFSLLAIIAIVLGANIMKVDWSEFLGSRLAQQGQLWWKTYSITNTPHLSELSDEINGFFHGSTNVADNVGANSGIYKVMYLCGKSSYIDFKLGAGSRFTEAGFAGAYYYAMLVGGILYSIINGIIFSKTLNAYINAINSRNWISMAILTRIFTIERTAYTMFLYGDLFDNISIISYIVLILLYVYKQLKRRRTTIDNGRLLNMRE